MIVPNLNTTTQTAEKLREFFKKEWTVCKLHKTGCENCEFYSEIYSLCSLNLIKEVLTIKKEEK